MNARQLAGMSMLMAGQLFYAGQGWADTWRQGVSSLVSTEYETNPAMSAANPGAVWRGVFSPSYSLMNRVGESTINAGFALQIVRSSNRTLSPDRDSPSMYLNWARPSDAGEFGISSKYAQVATRDSEGADATGHIPANSTRKSRALSGTWSKPLSERSTLSADALYEGVSYEGSATYTDYSTRSAGLKYDYVWDERITSFCRASGDKYLPANGGQATNRVDAALGMSWKTEYLEWSLQAGKSRVVGGSSDTQGLVAAHYIGQRSQLTFNAGRAVSSSGLGGYAKSDHVKGGWSYALNEYSNTGIDLERRKNFPTLLYGATTSTSSGVWLDHSLTPFWRIRNYYSRRTNQGAGVESASSNMVGLSLIFNNIDF